MAAEQDWLRLQKKIFARYVDQRLREGGVKKESITDLVAALADGVLIYELLEVMSGETVAKKPKPSTMKIKVINTLNEALKFVEKCGVDTKKCRIVAEDIYDKQEKPVLAFVFQIIIKYLKIEDDDDEDGKGSGDVRDALMLWLQNKTAGYEHITLKDFKSGGKQLANGMVFLALIHRMRPKLVDYAALDPANTAENLELALSLGEKYLGIDRYIDAADIPKLDELSTIVYLSDWYHGVFLLQKQDIAARRIGKLADMTKLHDELKVEYQGLGTDMAAWVTATIATLDKREFDDTLAGVQKKLQDFYAYKENEKASKVVTMLDIHSLFNNLKLRLANHKRPAFVPPEGTSPDALEAQFTALEDTEAKRAQALHEELARQVQLHKLAKRFSTDSAKLTTWVGEKDAYLKTDEAIDSVESAEDALAALGIHDGDVAHTRGSALADLAKLHATLEEGRFENQADIASKLSALNASFDGLSTDGASKRSSLDADLKKQQDINETLCAEFAAAVKTFIDFLTAQRTKASNEEGSLEELLAEVIAIAGASADTQLAAVEAADAAMTARGLVYNPKTTVTLGDCKAQWSLYQTFLKKKTTLLEEQIEESKRGGLSVEQIAEIDDNFKYFDKNGNDSLSRKELRVCLQSLGEEATPKDIKKILELHDTDKTGTINHAEFTSFMRKQLGDTDTEAEIVKSFMYLSYDKDVISEEQLGNVVNDKSFKTHHVDYLKTEMKPADDGHDFKTWTAEAFAR